MSIKERRSLVQSNPGRINCLQLDGSVCNAGHYGGVPTRYSCLTCPHREPTDPKAGLTLTESSEITERSGVEIKPKPRPAGNCNCSRGRDVGSRN